ncbi:MAG: ergothioneine biosynthesis protein EgtB [Rhodanobacter sp.]|jgi:ergothioneine biosynthesis protein EgtB|uniref:ergothioneine biosynthesis protein EgtB n=1 Tax=Rhodanobacter sp. KK11 TaxID=3083255 RepID=UPI00296718F9|nr:ergothioneine biosynthesis protein EgtB [Rhodanobacter sp. KK11]MDW2982141.1 ergothioneine biosynthesis protein EgtB [Rhodanobacter sp. KK11]
MTTWHSSAPAGIATRFLRVRQRTLELCAGLSAEDLQLQSMPDASPGKWHLAHTSWFFEQFVLGRDPVYRPRDPAWRYLFNSYYQSVGPMHARPQRGLLSRPSLDEVRDYRRYIDDAVGELLGRNDDAELSGLVELGLQHEQQHQELLLTDIKHALWCNPLQPAYRAPIAAAGTKAVPLRFVDGCEGIVEIGHRGEGFAFDNETPRHRTLLQPHALANRPVTNAEYLAFVREGGYREPGLWLSDGWATVQREGWQHPLYWQDDLASEFTLAGVRALDPHEPVCHLSYYEAEAFARWAGARLPTEAEWESAAQGVDIDGNLQDEGRFQPRAANGDAGLQQLYGDVWEWTASPYISYPGFRPLPGSLGEYNGKFMCGQWVLRGGSCVTPRDHLRASYRNFFPPQARWQFAGLRLGQDR